MREIEAEAKRPSGLPRVRALRHLPDQLLHPVRRRLVLSRLAGRGGVSSVLFICAGNIYRSPFAAEVFKGALPGPFRGVIGCASAGFIGNDRPSPGDAVAAAARRGLDLDSHRSRMLTPAHAGGSDLIVVMAPDQKRAICSRYGRLRRDVIVLGDLDPHMIETREIADPWDQPPHVLEASYDRVTRCVRELAAAVTGMGGAIRS